MLPLLYVSPHFTMRQNQSSKWRSTKLFPMAKREDQMLVFNKLRVYATVNKWKSNQKGTFFRFMLSESSLQVGSNELERNELTAHGL